MLELNWISSFEVCVKHLYTLPAVFEPNGFSIFHKEGLEGEVVGWTPYGWMGCIYLYVCVNT